MSLLHGEDKIGRLWNIYLERIKVLSAFEIYCTQLKMCLLELYLEKVSWSLLETLIFEHKTIEGIA